MVWYLIQSSCPIFLKLDSLSIKGSLKPSKSIKLINHPLHGFFNFRHKPVGEKSVNTTGKSGLKFVKLPDLKVCFCGFHNETFRHFFLECLLYSASRTNLLSSAVRIFADRCSSMSKHKTYHFFCLNHRYCLQRKF